ncbi:MAG: M24 family metallopeptidase [Proteobacteria bacterium]|nr:M24 family metallopeptidase [Pseudomonadota bacterium]
MLIRKSDPILLLKARKNDAEIRGIISAHFYDSIAVCKFLAWLHLSLERTSSGSTQVKNSLSEHDDFHNDFLNEISASEQILRFRQECSSFMYPSFDTISALNENGALIHYHAKPQTNKALKSNTQSSNLYLIDSGGQYSCGGTTDITRTVLIADTPGNEEKRNFTLVLKGHIHLAMAKFPIGTSGGHLDALARYYLWQYGLDYGHGTGHGIGHLLSVHEGPHGISPKETNVQLEAGMIVSIEPGYYKEGAYGIRIENVYMVVESQPQYKGFLEFQPLAFVPIDQKLIDWTFINNEEFLWLKRYNERIVSEIFPHLHEGQKHIMSRRYSLM